MDDDFHLAVAIQIQCRDHFVSVGRVEATSSLWAFR